MSRRAGVAAALKGMFRLRSNSPAEQEMLAQMDRLKTATEQITARTLDEAMQQIVGKPHA